MLSKTFEFGEFRLDLSQKTLRKNGEIVQIQPKVFDVLAVLVERNNELVSREELLDEVWGDTFVEETSVRLCIHALRKIFDGKFIETVPKRGYRLNVEIKKIDSGSVNNESVKPAYLKEEKPAESWKKNLSTVFATVAFVAILSLAFIWKNSSTRSEKMTIAVLPFSKITEKTEKNLALTDAVIVQLQRLKDFQILPINAVQKYTTQDLDVLAVGKELRSDAVLHGRFRQNNGNVSVSVNLQNIATGEILWTESFDVKPDEKIGFEKSVGARLARLFSLRLVEYEDEKAAKTQNVNPEALNAYLSARKIWRSRDLGRVDEMDSLLQKAKKLEPNWALAYSANSEALLTNDYIRTSFDEGENEANRAIELDERQHGALAVLGQVAMIRDLDFEKAEAFYKKSIEVNPTYASTYNEYAKLLSYKRGFAESERWIKKALEIEPFSPLYNTTLCQTYYFDKKYDAALAQCRFALQLEPNFWNARKQLFWIYVQKKMNKEVADLILEKLSDEAKTKLPYIKSLQKGDLEEYWRHIISQPSNSPAPSTDSLIYLQLGEKEKALGILEKILESDELNYLEIKAEPILEPLWGEPRFIELTKKTIKTQ